MWLCDISIANCVTGYVNQQVPEVVLELEVWHLHCHVYCGTNIICINSCAKTNVICKEKIVWKRKNAFRYVWYLNTNHIRILNKNEFLILYVQQVKHLTDSINLRTILCKSTTKGIEIKQTEGGTLTPFIICTLLWSSMKDYIIFRHLFMAMVSLSCSRRGNGVLFSV